MTEKENKAVVNAEMEEAIAEAHLPEVIIDDGAEKQEESLARPARMITDDFDQDNPVEFIHPEDEIRLKWSEIRNDASRRRIKNCEVLGCSKMPRDPISPLKLTISKQLFRLRSFSWMELFRTILTRQTRKQNVKDRFRWLKECWELKFLSSLLRRFHIITRRPENVHMRLRPVE